MSNGFRAADPGGREVIALQHTASETLGTIGGALLGENMAVRPVRIHAGEPAPASLDAASGLLVMGGPMGVYEQDRFPFLRDELSLIERAVAGGVPVLGICLGSQLLASALGASVRKGSGKEIGWHRVFLEPGASHDPLLQGAPPEFEAFHWHGDVFDLPNGTVPLARSVSTKWRFDMRPTPMGGMIADFPEELGEEGIESAELTAQTARNLPGLQSVGAGVWGHWSGMVAAQFTN